jgi:hypothetical protein
MKNVLIDVGVAFTNEEFSDLFKSSIYNIIYVGEQFNIDIVSKIDSNGKVLFYNYKSLYNYKKNGSFEYTDDIVKILDVIINDKLTLDLYDRCLAGYYLNYSTEAESIITSMVVSAYKFIKDFDPSFLIYFECSHNIKSWIVGRIAEILGIPVKYGRNNVLHWRNVFLEGMNKNATLLQGNLYNEKANDFELKLFDSMIERYKNGIDSIKPEFMEVMKEKKTKKLYSLSNDIKANWKNPPKVLYKYYCYKRYTSLCSKAALPDKFIVFYLHLQPERSTLPEGYGFQSQYKAILLLSELIPDDWYIVVKEHPATFYTHCKPFGRWPKFYDELVSIKKVRLVKLESDPYYLISKSICVSTITGTIAGEALLMGKPVINFGLNSLMASELPIGMYNYIDMKSLSDFIAKLQAFKSDEITNSYISLVKTEILNIGTCGIKSINDWNNSFDALVNSDRIGRFKIVKNILTH